MVGPVHRSPIPAEPSLFWPEPRQLSVNCPALCQGFFTDEDTHLVKKVTLYVDDNWNKCDMVAIFLFIVGVTCRSVGQPQGGWGQAAFRMEPLRASGVPRVPGTCAAVLGSPFGSRPPPPSAERPPQDAAAGV